MSSIFVITFSSCASESVWHQCTVSLIADLLLPSDGRFDLYPKYACPKFTQRPRALVSSAKVPGSVTSHEMQSEP